MSKALAELAAVIGASSTDPKPAPSNKLNPTTKEEKFKALKAVEAALNKQFGSTHTLVKLGDKVGHPMPSIGGDLYTLDYGVIGTGGLPRGRMIELFGQESSGKTTLALHYAAKEQKRGGVVAYIDAEHALDASYMAQLGVNVDELTVSQPNSGEEALETVGALVDARAVDLIIVDSVAALTPQAELDGDFNDSHMGLQARMMSQAMRKLRGGCAMSGIPIIWINQLRTNIGQTYGDPSVTTGGKALKFYASVRLDVRRVGGPEGQIKSGDVLIGHRMRLRAVKNKVGVPARSTEVDLIYGKGIDTFADFVTYAKEVGAIQQRGAWFYFGDKNLAQGLDKTISLLRDQPDLMEQIKGEVAKAQAAQQDADKP